MTRLFLFLSVSYALNHIQYHVCGKRKLFAIFIKGLDIISIQCDKDQKLNRYRYDFTKTESQGECVQALILIT